MSAIKELSSTMLGHGSHRSSVLKSLIHPVFGLWSRLSRNVNDHQWHAARPRPHDIFRIGIAHRQPLDVSSKIFRFV